MFLLLVWVHHHISTNDISVKGPRQHARFFNQGVAPASGFFLFMRRAGQLIFFIQGLAPVSNLEQASSPPVELFLSGPSAVIKLGECCTLPFGRTNLSLPNGKVQDPPFSCQMVKYEKNEIFSGAARTRRHLVAEPSDENKTLLDWCWCGRHLTWK